MPPKFWPKFGLPGILHHYTSDEHLVVFEYSSPNTIPKPNTILFVGGLSDGLSTTSYTADLIRALEPTSWSLFTITLSSSYNQWGMGSLDRDTDEIAECVGYIKEYKNHKYSTPNPENGHGEEGEKEKVVLMGHLTGSQMVLHYFHGPNPHRSTSEPHHPTRPILHGAILQAPVSDREAILSILPTGFDNKSPSQIQKAYCDLITAMAIDAQRPDQSTDVLIPLSLTIALCYSVDTPITSRRLRSLISPESLESLGEDDLFSLDLSDEVLKGTFGIIGERGLLRGGLVVLFSGSDKSVPDWVDKVGLIGRWRKAADEGGLVRKVWDDEGSGVIEGASHGLSDDDQEGPREELCRRVLGYLGRLEST